MKVISGHQPSYLPWLGLCHKMTMADHFVLMDDVKYNPKEFQNRNKIKGGNQTFWLTVPVLTGTHDSNRIADTAIDTSLFGSPKNWQSKHWKSLVQSYRKAPYWEDYAPFFESLYHDHCWENLAELNIRVLEWVRDILEIDTKFVRASKIGFDGRKSDLVLDHCLKLDGDICVLGLHGRDYIKEDEFTKRGISLYYQNYCHPTYPQLGKDFAKNLSFIDLLFNVGGRAKEYIVKDNIRKEDLLFAASSSDSAKVLTIDKREVEI